MYAVPPPIEFYKGSTSRTNSTKSEEQEKNTLKIGRASTSEQSPHSPESPLSKYYSSTVHENLLQKFSQHPQNTYWSTSNYPVSPNHMEVPVSSMFQGRDSTINTVHNNSINDHKIMMSSSSSSAPSFSSPDLSSQTMYPSTTHAHEHNPSPSTHSLYGTVSEMLCWIRDMISKKTDGQKTKEVTQDSSVSSKNELDTDKNNSNGIDMKDKCSREYCRLLDTIAQIGAV